MVVVVVVLVGAVIAGVLLTSGGKKSTTARAGRQAPDFTLPSLQDGKGPISLASYKGTPVLVNFWATWCTPCVQEMPLLEAAHAKWGSKVQFVGIDRQDYKPDALTFAQKTRVTYPLASDPNATLDGAYRLRGMPTSVFIDRDGHIVDQVTGPVTRSQLDDTLKAMTEARSVEVRGVRKPRNIWIALVVGVGLITTACAKHAPQSTLKPAGPVARKIDGLFHLTFWIAAAVFVIVEFGVVYLVIRYRGRADRPEPVQVHGNSRLEITWAVIPALLLLVVAVPTFKTIFDLARNPKDALQVTVTGHQFWWQFDYPQLGITTANEPHLPIGRNVSFTVRSDDVIHSFWIPPLSGKHDAEPGRSATITMEADKPGVYLGQCAEFCGLSHANMRLRAFADTAGDFDKWVAAQKAPPPTATTGTAAGDGFTLFAAKGCIGCHTVNGVSTGMVGPNLTHVYSRSAFAGDTFDMTPTNLAMWLHDPPGVKPGSKMPNLGLSSAEITNLIAYLQTLK